MTISKNLLLVATLALSTQFITYTISLDENKRILAIIQDLGQINDCKTQHIAQWLEQRMFTDSFDAQLAENILLIMDHPTLQAQSKIYFLNRLIKIETDNQKDKESISKKRYLSDRWNFLADVIAIVAPIGIFFFLGASMIKPKELTCKP